MKFYENKKKVQDNNVEKLVDPKILTTSEHVIFELGKWVVESTWTYSIL